VGGLCDLSVPNAASDVLETAHSKVLTRGEGLAEDEVPACLQRAPGRDLALAEELQMPVKALSGLL
jgi:hypothetical protein